MSTRDLLSVTDATILAISLSTLYVLGYYLALQSRHRRARQINSSAHQHDPSPIRVNAAIHDVSSEIRVVRSRLATMVVTCIVATGLVYWPVYRRSVPEPNLAQFFAQLGIRSTGFLYAITLPLLLIIILFLGPLVHMYLENELFFQDPIILDLFFHRLSSAHGQRSYFLGPICEEYIFRSCIILPYYHARVSFSAIVGYTPLFFGLAHLHNIYDLYCRNGHTSDALIRGIVTSLFQFTYTTVFGWLTAWIYLRTGHVISVMVMHMFCNIMGVPSIGEVQLTKRPNLVWTAYIVGLLAFLVLAGPMTAPRLYGNTMFVDA